MTSQPAPDTLMKLWDSVLECYDEIVYIPMSSGLSSSCGTAMMLSYEEKYENKVFVVDNQRISVTQRRSVMDAIELAQEVDFFSVGTNDLTQYTLAIDRQNPKLDNIYDSHHPAILKMLKMIVDNGHKGGCWVD